MATVKTRTFGQAILQRRRQLELTQKQIARRLRVSSNYIGHLEGGTRHPSAKMVMKLAGILGLDPRELFLLANPEVNSMMSEQPSSEASVWDSFVKDEKLRKIHNITDEEIEALSRVARLGSVRSPRDFIFILNAIRQALSP